MTVANLIVSDGSGHFIEVPELQTAGVNFIKPLTPQPEELIPLPEGSKIMELPRRVAIGYDPDLEKHLQLREYNGSQVYPVAVSLPPGYLQIYRSAFSMVLDSPRLPPGNYTVGGGKDHQYFTTAIAIPHQLFPGYEIFIPDNMVAAVEKIVDHAVQCLLHSPNCLIQLNVIDDNQIPKIIKIVKDIRQETDQGFIYINSNRINPAAIKEWCDAGADWIGMNLNSAQPKYFERLYEKQGYKFETVQRSLQTIDQSGSMIILNYGVFPGLTDHPDELKAFEALISQVKLAALHPYNLPVDPEWYMDKLLLMTLPREQLGMKTWWEYIQKNYSEIKIGYWGGN